jgi:voltage-gated potassium channel
MFKSPQVQPLKRLLQKLEWPLAIMALLVVPALILEDRTTNPTVRILCNGINWCVWIAFAAEFVLGLNAADRRRTFLRKSWFELLIILASPPFGVPDVLQGLRGLRALRLLRLLRLVRGLAVATIGLRTAKKSLQSHGFHYVFIVALVATALGAAGIYIVEREFTIKSPQDALWWSIVTVTAVGHGDVTPVTAEGRLIALALMFVGIGVISVFTATIASAFVGEGHEKEARSVDKRLAALEDQVREVLQELKRSNPALALSAPARRNKTRKRCTPQQSGLRSPAGP